MRLNDPERILDQAVEKENRALEAGLECDISQKQE